MPIVQPPGGHAIYIDAGAILPAHPAGTSYPGQALAVELYLRGRHPRRGDRHGDVRAAAIPRPARRSPRPHELVRLAIPRRVYTQSHMDYVIEAMGELAAERESIRGVEIIEQPPVLRHFSAVFKLREPA